MMIKYYKLNTFYIHTYTHPVAASPLKNPHLRYLLFHEYVRILGSVGCDFLPHWKVFRHLHSLLGRYENGGFIHIHHVHSDGGRGRGQSDIKGGHILHSHVENVLLLGLKIQALKSRKMSLNNVYANRGKEKSLIIIAFVNSVSMILKPGCTELENPKRT